MTPLAPANLSGRHVGWAGNPSGKWQHASGLVSARGSEVHPERLGAAKWRSWLVRRGRPIGWGSCGTVAQSIVSHESMNGNCPSAAPKGPAAEPQPFTTAFYRTESLLARTNVQRSRHDKPMLSILTLGNTSLNLEMKSA